MLVIKKRGLHKFTDYRIKKLREMNRVVRLVQKRSVKNVRPHLVKEEIRKKEIDGWRMVKLVEKKKYSNLYFEKPS